MEYVECNLCGKTEGKKLYAEKNVHAVLCLSCSLVYLNPRMTAQEYEAHYRNQYQISRHHVFDKKSAIERLEKKKSYQQKQNHLPFFEGFISPQTTVLEVGSGWGTFLKVIQDNFHCSVQGIEISALAAQVAREYYGLSITEQPFESYITETKGKLKYDFIMMHHVLEHFLDPFEILKNTHLVLAENGHVYIGVPNVARPDELLEKFFRIEHTYYFTPLTLVRLLEKTGFEVEKLFVTKSDIKVIAKKGTKKYESASIDITGTYIRTTIMKRRFFEKIKNFLRPIYFKIVKNKYVWNYRGW